MTARSESTIAAASPPARLEVCRWTRRVVVSAGRDHPLRLARWQLPLWILAACIGCGEAEPVRFAHAERLDGEEFAEKPLARAQVLETIDATFGPSPAEIQLPDDLIDLMESPRSGRRPAGHGGRRGRQRDRGRRSHTERRGGPLREALPALPRPDRRRPGADRRLPLPSSARLPPRPLQVHVDRVQPEADPRRPPSDPPSRDRRHLDARILSPVDRRRDGGGDRLCPLPQHPRGVRAGLDG